MTAVVGLDLSLTSTGYAFVLDGKVDGGGTIKSKGKKGDTVRSKALRLMQITNSALARVVGADADLVVIEAPSFGSTTGQQHERGGLWWMVATELSARGFPIATVAPTTRAKYGTGNGRASKDEVLAAVIGRYRDLPGDWAITGNDVADAVLLAAMGSRHLGVPVEADGLPQRNLEAMGGATWPS